MNGLHIISRIPKEAISVAELSDRVDVPKQIVANLVRTATDNGYLQGSDEELTLTPQGREAMHVIQEAQRKIEKGWETAIGASAYVDLRSHLVERLRHSDA